MEKKQISDQKEQGLQNKHQRQTEMSLFPSIAHMSLLKILVFWIK